MNQNRHRFRMEQKKRKRKRVFLWVLVPLLVLAVGSSAYLAYLYNVAKTSAEESYDEDFNRETKYRKEAVNPEKDNVSVLFIGVDDSESRDYGEATRSDALMLATFNVEDKTVKLVSIPRDSYVYIDEVGYYTRINHAHAYGGPSLTMQTVEELLEIPIDYYVRLDFYAFMDVVDALGGIEAEVPYEIWEKDAEDNREAIHLLPGMQELNGEEALALARTRKLDNDMERGKRQQEILKAILDKAVSVGAITKYPEIMRDISANTKTNLTFDEMKSFVNYALSGDLQIENLQLKGSDSMINGAYYYQLDEAALAELKAVLQTHLELEGTSVAKSDDEDLTN
ncbi:LytR family transcriptional attenuator [Bacillus oleivorans]|uniref:LytR family transcriptional attenuator n=1 Tax=Bacillus oleivorans TaxID=1448271 RepID=A0A285D0W8_9BACI|nr:LCP family protein [Bacillus oleivorans]SNX72946.1 LytR family transcriptional attenuator [Bacillus oleivorans]